MAETRILSNVPYTIHNNSNYDIVAEETRDIVDIPYAPAQNLVDVSGELNLYAPKVLFYFALKDQYNQERLFGFFNRTDARVLFVEFADDARYLQYRFAGNSYPQGREDATYTYDEANLYLFGGMANGRCMGDLWKYSLRENRWVNLNFSEAEKGANQSPSKRRKASIINSADRIWMFGGETDVLTINTASTTPFFVPLNDVWSFNANTNEWINYDRTRALPHRPGNIVYADTATIRILIKGGVNEIGVTEPTAIWTVNIATDTVTQTAITIPFTPTSKDICIKIGDSIHILVGDDLYKWNNGTNTFTLVKDGVSAYSIGSNVYWSVVVEEMFYGQNSTMGKASVNVGICRNLSDAIVSRKTIKLPPKGISIPAQNIDNLFTLYYGGMIDSGHFNEATYLLNHATLNVEKYTFIDAEKPTERVFPAMAYDKYRGRMWLFGGFDGSKFYNDLWYFDLGTKKWIKFSEQTSQDSKSYPPPRQKAGMCIVLTDSIYIVGGYSDIRSFNDIWVYNFLTGTWSTVVLTDDLPWGSQYFIFEWYDRLWLYNGQQLYRYFHQLKQFKAQPFLIASSSGAEEEKDPVLELIETKEFLNTPITCTVVSDTMIVQNTEFLFSVDLYSKVMTNYVREFSLGALSGGKELETVKWLDKYWAIGITSLDCFYVNLSPLQPLTKNQIPHSMYSKKLDSVLPEAIFYVDPAAVLSTSKAKYQDTDGVFDIQAATLPLNKSILYVDKKISFTSTKSKYPNFDWQDQNAIAAETLDLIARPTVYPYAPWFLYQQFKTATAMYEGAQCVIYNKPLQRIYVIYQNGNTLKINPDDNTFFAYFTKLWNNSAIGYHQLQNKIYCFGGVRNERASYFQNGLEAHPIVVEKDPSCWTEDTHPGLMQFDLSINEMNLGSIENYQREHEVASVDYTKTREYLVGLLTKYVEATSTNTMTASIEATKEKIYLETQSLVDDMSQFDFSFENGDRPLGRGYSANCQIQNKLYMFGGCEAFQSGCIPNQQGKPECTRKPGFLINTKNETEPDDPNYINTDATSREAFVFDMDRKEWKKLAPLNKWRYCAACLASPDNRYIYIVGGYSAEQCEGLVKDITIYDTQTNSYEEMKGLPERYRARANPILQWLDENRLLIMYGHYTLNPVVGEAEPPCAPPKKYMHVPIGDAWILDTKADIMYECFADNAGFMGIVAKDTFYVDEAQKENILYIMTPFPEKNSEGTPILNVYQWNLVNGEVENLIIRPTSEIINDYSAFKKAPTKDAMIENNTPPGDESPEDMIKMYMKIYTDANFRFRYAWIEQYGPFTHKHMFILGERAEQSGIKAMEAMASGHKEAHLRFWYVDLEMPEYNRFLFNITYEYPLPLSPVLLTYDGSRYIYCIYNKNNIWRLDFKNVLLDPSGSWWYMLPPCMDCNFLGDSTIDTVWDSYYIRPNYLVLQSKDGKLARMDTQTFVWFLDKSEPPAAPIRVAGRPTPVLTSASGIDNNETYLYGLGGICGKVMNVYERQWDNFFFDMRATSKVASNLGKFVSSGLWPTVVRRRRLYTINHLGHIFYAWLRIDGEYDVEFQLNDFYDGHEVRIYGDYNLLNAYQQIKVSVFDIQQGWVDIHEDHISAVINEVGWDWDGQYARQYVRIFIDQNGDVACQYSKQPPNYIRANLKAAFSGKSRPVSKIRVYYKNIPKPYNYISRINKVELLTDQTIVANYDTELATTPLAIVHIEPLLASETFSNEFAVHIKNTGDKTAKDVIAYAYDNKWIQFTKTPANPDNWGVNTQKAPFNIASEIAPGGHEIFYIRAINIDQRPHIQDLVVKGVYPYEG